MKWLKKNSHEKNVTYKTKITKRPISTSATKKEEIKLKSNKNLIFLLKKTERKFRTHLNVSTNWYDYPTIKKKKIHKALFECQNKIRNDDLFSIKIF